MVLRCTNAGPTNAKGGRGAYGHSKNGFPQERFQAKKFTPDDLSEGENMRYGTILPDLSFIAFKSSTIRSQV